MRLHCSICQEHHPLELFRFLPCGHGFCIDSLQRYTASERKPCPTCRQPFRIRDAHAIYIESFDTDPHAPPTQLLNEESTLPYTDDVLRQASYAKEIAALRKDLRAADAAKNRMHQEKDQAQRLASQAVDTADQARREVVILRGEKDALKKRIDVQARDLGEQLAEKTRDRTNLCDMIVAHKEKEAKQKAKIAVLRQELAELQSTRKPSHQATPRTPIQYPKSSWQSFDRLDFEDGDLDVLAASPSPQSLQVVSTSYNSDSELDYGNPEREPIPALFPVPTNLPEPPAPQRPTFPTDWSLRPPERRGKRKRVESSENPFGNPPTFPIALDERGRPKGAVQLGPRQKHRAG
ncbi:uncharacterized protein LAESUDRAFT_651887 [Laetiporus sulphureus 93-53]|uniref:RING-type domain-containing protein n=1 Tax=Laetiporus sulphureus 93-53 TaxID=1314785 RepID=A0A165ELV4_9APHY|nr:uncharacterized protein LAESUDRAFT_651887 [Laetiporus sulphureus 93-53]KZT07328.1 hypothetical protein LAESUDRAFT_651887 [Laetiporus sulphureus 93-53]